MTITNKSVFISYSHADRNVIDQMKRHFSSLKQISFWDDHQILPGQVWRDEITKELNKASVAILVISADFFSSRFITDVELPNLLSAAETKGLTILTLIAQPCLFSEYSEINKYQAVNTPNHPLSKMDRTEQEELFMKLALRIKDLLK